MAKWVRKVQKRRYQGKDYPMINLPAELRDWIGKRVEIEEVSPTELKVRLVPED